MAKGAGRGRGLLVLASLALLALLLAGFVTGAIGSALMGGSSLLPEPEIHLAPQQVLGEHAGEAIHGGYKLLLTNTILSSLIASATLLLLFGLGASRMRLVPGRLQSLLEMAVEGLLGFVESAVGRERARSIFPLIATIFLFVFVNAWLGLLPVYQSLGFHEGEGLLATERLKATLLRPAGTDLNMPLALALVSFVFVEGLGLRVQGFRYLSQFFQVRSLLRGRLFMGLIELFVGVLEAVSHLVRVVSFTFRLFGNMTAGEILLLVTAFLVSFVVSLPFYGLELLVGFIQALIFAGLTLVFAATALVSHEEEHH